MPNTKVLQLSFAGGEVSSDFAARPDARQYANAASAVKNMYVLPQGPVQTRRGLKHVSYSQSLVGVYGNDLRLFTHTTSIGNFVTEIAHNGSASYAAFYKDGEPVRAATIVADLPQDATAITLGSSGLLTFPDKHGLVGGTAVRLRSTGTMPTGLSVATTYYVVSPSTTRSVSLSTAIGGLPVAINGFGSGTLRVFHRDSANGFAQDYHDAIATAAADWNSGTEQITIPGHNFRGGEIVELTSAGGLPGGITLFTTYAVVVVDEDTISLSVSYPTVLPFGAGAAGTLVLRSYYQQGEVVYFHSTVGALPGPGFYYCYQSHIDGCPNPPSGFAATTNANYWFGPNLDGTIWALLPYGPGNIAGLNGESFLNRLVLSNPGFQVRQINGPLAGTFNLKFTVAIVALGPTIAPPSQGLLAVPYRGQTLTTTYFFGQGGFLQIRFGARGPGLSVGDVIYCSSISPPTGGIVAEEFYVVDAVGATGAATDIQVRSFSTGIAIASGIGLTAVNATFHYSSGSSEKTQTYVLTSVDANDVESDKSSEFSATNQVLSVEGANNSLTWGTVTGAERYRIYKKLNGLFGVIGESVFGSFVDRNIGPDLGKSPPFFDSTLTTGYPQAVASFQQRRVIAGSYSYPQGVWLSKAGSENDFTFSLPVRDDDRLFFQIDSVQAQTIIHMVAGRDLVVMTNRGEWIVSGPNGQGLSPTNISVQRQSDIGCTYTRPIVVGNLVLFEATNSGHIHALGYQFQRQSYNSPDLCLRAKHLFDGYSIYGMAYQRSPHPIVWAVSSSGDLLCCTFVPEEEVVAFSRVQSDGATFVDVCVTKEGTEDAVYVAVERGGSRRIERMQSLTALDSDVAACLDSYVSSYDSVFSEQWPLSMVISRINLLTAGSTVKIVSYNPGLGSTQTGFAPQDVGDLLSFGNGVVVRISEYVSYCEIRAVLLSDLPPAFVATELTSMAFATKKLYGLAHHEGATVRVVADGVVSDRVVSGGCVTLDAPAFYKHAGLPYECELTTLPVAFQVEALAQGRAKDISTAYLRMPRLGAGLTIGPDSSNLVPVGSLDNGEVSGEYRVTLLPKWTQSGSITIRQTQPFVAQIQGITLDVVTGG